MQIEHDSELRAELVNWGLWAQDCPSRSLNYPHKSNYTTSKSSIVIGITDDRALEIDKAVAKLFTGDDEALKLFKWYFVCGFSYRMIAKNSGISKEKAQSIINNCVSWLAGYLYKTN